MAIPLKARAIFVAGLLKVRLRWVPLMYLLAMNASIAAPTVDIAFSRAISQFTDGRIVARDIQSQFDCSERIHAVLSASQFEPGLHKLTTRWSSPSGIVEKSSVQRINIRSVDRVVYLASSIEFASDSFMLKLLDPAAGYEKYIGLWTVSLLDGSDQIGSEKFKVIC